MLAIILCLCAFIQLIWGQAIVPSTYIATYVPYETNEGIGFYYEEPFTEVIYSDADVGQRYDIFIDNTSTPYYSMILINYDGQDRMLYLINKWKDVNIPNPICFESIYPPALLNITLYKKIGVGVVNAETTIAYIDNNENWIEVVNNTQGRYYPRAISSVYSSGLFTDFQMAIPFEEAWERPNCFPDWPIKRSIAPPVAPVPASYSYTVYDMLFQANVYIDGINNFYRSDSTFAPHGKYPALVLTNLFHGSASYVSIKWMPITPAPCVYMNISSFSQDVNFGGVYIGTVPVGNKTAPKDLNFYTIPQSEVYSAFDSVTHNLEAIYYLGGPENLVSGWNPTAPVQSLFNVPTPCYAMPSTSVSSNSFNPLAPTFPKGITLSFFDGYDQYTLYTDAVNQMWRIDGPEDSAIQVGNTMYSFPNMDLDDSVIKPLPCYQYPNPYTLIPDLPMAFSNYVGNASFNGVPVTIWSGGGQLWYWDSTNTPQFFLNGPTPAVVTLYQPSTPPAITFKPPTFCLASTATPKTKFLNRPRSPIQRSIKLNKPRP